jgi:hypothetical protein
MYCRLLCFLLLCCSLNGEALAACAPVRFAYVDKDHPPYWLGDGDVVPERPGVGAEVAQAFAASAGCGVSFRRLPTLRIPAALAAGAVDFAPVGLASQNVHGIAFPRDKNGQLDPDRAIPMMLVVFVRAGDGLARDLDPAAYFQHHLLGIALGSNYLTRLKQAGLKVDSGGTSVEMNIEKLKLHRVDGVAVTLLSPGDMDKYMAALSPDIMRLDQPLYADRVWLAASQSYYDEHAARVEAMWTWLGKQGKSELARLLKKYDAQP